MPSEPPPTQVSTSEAEKIHGPSNSHPMVTRAKAGIIKPNPTYAIISQKIMIEEPTSVKEALQDEGWLKAMKGFSPRKELDMVSSTKAWGQEHYWGNGCLRLNTKQTIL